MIDWKKKLSSRKFWLASAAFLGSIAASVAGLASQNQTIAAVGIICGMLSSAIYAFCEAWVDASRESNIFKEKEE